MGFGRQKLGGKFPRVQGANLGGVPGPFGFPLGKFSLRSRLSGNFFFLKGGRGVGTFDQVPDTHGARDSGFGEFQGRAIAWGTQFVLAGGKTQGCSSGSLKFFIWIRGFQSLLERDFHWDFGFGKMVFFR